MVVPAIERAILQRIADRNKRSGSSANCNVNVGRYLDDFCNNRKAHITAQTIDWRRRFERGGSPGRHDAEITEMVLREVESLWSDPYGRLNLVPGKEALSGLNSYIQENCQINITPMTIIDAMHLNEIPDEMKGLIDMLKSFSGVVAAD